MIFCQGTFGGLLLLFIFVAIQHVPLGNASAIFFCTPVATFIFATFMLREPLKCYRFMIIVFMMSGVALITRPNFLGFARDNKTTLSTGEFRLKNNPEFCTKITLFLTN